MAEQIVEKALQQALVDLIELSLRGKQMHWNIQGENFRDLHEFLDVVIEHCRTNYDEIAERMAALQLAADGRAETVAKTTILEPIESGILSTSKVYQQMEANLLAVSKNILKTLSEVDEADRLSADILGDACHDLEKDAWMLRSQGA